MTPLQKLQDFGEVDKVAFWRTFMKAVDADLREARFVRGASGVEHPVLAAGVDDARRRVVVVSQEHDARAAAMALADMQYAHPDLQILLARPVAINLGEAAQTIADLVGKKDFAQTDLASIPQGEAMIEPLVPLIEKASALFQLVDLNTMGQILQAIQQLALVRIEGASPGHPSFRIHLDSLADHDPARDDARYGICSIPLFRFSPHELSVLSGVDVEAAADLLKRADILQYFFPAADQLALGLADRGTRTPSELVKRLSSAPALGHPYGAHELVEPSTRLEDVVDALKERGLTVEGEVGIEVSDAGKVIRTAIRFKPREGVVSKLVNRISISINLKDLFGGKP